jgi:hypothetical protein
MSPITETIPATLTVEQLLAQWKASNPTKTAPKAEKTWDMFAAGEFHGGMNVRMPRKRKTQI